jgi:hypothetical protein
MTLPASVRVNVQFPFPALVQGESGIGVSKANGIWTIAPNFSALATIPSLANPTSKEIWVFDPVSGIYNVMTLAALSASLLTDTSSSSVTIATGAQSFLVNPGKAWTIGSFVIASTGASPLNYMVGQVTSYATAAGVTTLTLNVLQANGSGTFSAWNLALTGPPSLGPSSIEFLFDGGGAPLPAGFFGYVEAPFNATILRATLAGNVAGNAQCDVWKVPAGGFPPTSANSIVAADPPTLNAAQFMQDSTLAGWTTQINAGDILAFVLTSTSGINQLTLSLALQRR